MNVCANWKVDWEAVAAIGTLLAVATALGTTLYLEWGASRRRRIEIRSMASALYWEFSTIRASLLKEIGAFDASPAMRRAAAEPPILGTNGRYGRLRFLRLAEGIRRCKFSVLRSFANRTAQFNEKDAISLGMLIAAVLAFEENQDMDANTIFSIDDEHAEGTEAAMRAWAQTIAELLGPAAERMAVIAGIRPPRA